jgi:hypothetical protein
MNNAPLTEQDFDDLINDFIKKWIPEHYPHLVDTDENDGEKLRQDIKEKVQSARNGAIQEIKDFEIFNPILEKRIIAILNKWFNIGD